jgi:hypothetical protein
MRSTKGSYLDAYKQTSLISASKELGLTYTYDNEGKLGTGAEKISCIHLVMAMQVDLI